MKFTILSKVPAGFAAALSLASHVSGGAAGTGLRGNGDDARKLVSTQSNDCLVQASALLHIPGTPFIDDLQIGCEMAAVDTNGMTGQFRSVKGNLAQMNQLKQMVRDGQIVPGSTRLALGDGVGVSSIDLVLPSNFDPKMKIIKEEKDNGQGNDNGQGEDSGKGKNKGKGKGKGKNKGKGNGQGKNKGKGKGNSSFSRRLGGDVVGDKPILVVKVTDSVGRAREESAIQIGDDIFGSVNDPVNLKSQLYDCSHGVLNVVPGDNGSSNPVVDQDKYSAPGVIEITIDIDITTASDRYAIHNAVTAEVQEYMGFSLPGPYEQVMYVLEKCYVGCGWAAYAYVNSWMSVYQDVYYKQVGVLVHELGHNFGLAHSGGLNNAAYTDHTGMMGNPLYSDDTGRMCYNAAKNWQIGWYDDNKLLLEPLTEENDWIQTVNMVGIADYKNNPEGYAVVVKLETGLPIGNDYFVAFNRATGVNADNDQADDEVTIVQVDGGNGESYSQSYLKATLSQGEAYTISSFGGTSKNIVVEVTNINLSTNPGTATIVFGTDQAPTAAPTTNTFCDDQPDKKSLKVIVGTDNYSSETSWTLVNQCTGQTQQSSAVDLGSPAYPASNTEFSNQFCIPEAEYIFTISDSYGDGICCGYGQGWYRVEHGGDEVATGGEFGSSESSEAFGSCNPTAPPPSPPPTILATPPVTPPPTNFPTNPPTTTSPTNPPTNFPTNPPTTTSPTNPPTNFPTNPPTNFPTNPPTNFPTNPPTNFPTNPPTNLPTNPPTNFPTNPPTNFPTNPPTNFPTNPPTNFPTNPPTNLPTNPPTNFPTNPPTNPPTSGSTQLCKVVDVEVTDTDGNKHTLGRITIPSTSEVGTVHFEVDEVGMETCPAGEEEN